MLRTIFEANGEAAECRPPPATPAAHCSIRTAALGNWQVSFWPSVRHTRAAGRDRRLRGCDVLRGPQPLPRSDRVHHVQYCPSSARALQRGNARGLRCGSRGMVRLAASLQKAGLVVALSPRSRELISDWRSNSSSGNLRVRPLGTTGNETPLPDGRQRPSAVIVVCCLLLCSATASATITLNSPLPSRNDRFYIGPDRTFDSVFPYNWSGEGRYAQWGTLISPDYFLTANHYTPGVGGTLYFYSTNDSTGPREARTVTWGTQIFGLFNGVLTPTDLWLGKLDAPLERQDRLLPALQAGARQQSGPSERESRERVQRPAHLHVRLVY